MDNDRLNDEETVNIITEHCNSHSYKIFTIEEYNFDELEINVQIEKSRFTDNFQVVLLAKTYMNDDYSYEFCIMNFLDHKIFTDIKEIVYFLLKDFRKNFMYSKLLDEIHLKNEIEKKEKITKAYSVLCKNKMPDTCCVCLEYNKLITRCNHNVCRICYNKIKKLTIEIVNNNEIKVKSCPLCRLPI